MDIGKFTTIGFIGGGNFGKVFRVKDNLLNVDRALKIISTQNAQQFVDAINEAQILEKCRHKHIVDIKEIDIHDVNGTNLPCIATEYLKNGSVQSYLEKKFVSIKVAVKIISDSLFGLEHAHTQNVFHRDIKPANILFSDTWDAKLSDFGLAYGLKTQAFNFAGYGPHLAPEVLENVAQDELSDLYSTGLTFYRLVNNIPNLSLPFADDAEWLKALKKEKFPERKFSPHVPEQIIRIVKKAIKAERSDRYQSCMQFRQAVQKINLAIEWIPNDKDLWKGEYNGDYYELRLYNKRTGYFIDFEKNGRIVKEKSCIQIQNEDLARHEFFKLIRQTTINI